MDAESQQDRFRATTAYDVASQFLHSRINYERAEKMPYSPKQLGLDRMHRLLDLVGEPHRKVPLIHVAGTKGKGSTTSYLCRALAAAGFSCGSYTSPHLHHVEERFRINGEPCRPETLTHLIETIRPAVEQMDGEREDRVTYFEIATTIGFLLFLEQNVDIAVVEVGLGGRLDSTNVCHPLVSVITSISYDHTKQLGNTLALIAAEKCGIIKPGIPVVSGCTQQEPKSVIERISQERAAKLVQYGQDFRYSNYRFDQQRMCAVADLETLPVDDQASTEQPTRFRDVQLGPLGRHQAQNASVAWATLQALPERFHVDESPLRTGFRDADVEARIEIVSTKPTVIVDAAHNVASVAALIETLQELPKASSGADAQRHWLILGMTKGKDIAGMLKLLLPNFERIICTRYQSNPRGITEAVLVQMIESQLKSLPQPHPEVESFATPQEAWRHVTRNRHEQDRICIAGSFFIASEIRDLILRDNS